MNEARGNDFLVRDVAVLKSWIVIYGLLGSLAGVFADDVREYMYFGSAGAVVRESVSLEFHPVDKLYLHIFDQLRHLRVHDLLYLLIVVKIPLGGRVLLMLKPVYL